MERDIPDDMPDWLSELVYDLRRRYWADKRDQEVYCSVANEIIGGWKHNE